MSNIINVLYYCILYSKYYIYIHILCNNNYLDLYTCLTQPIKALEIEYKTCKAHTSLFKLQT